MCQASTRGTGFTSVIVSLCLFFHEYEATIDVWSDPHECFAKPGDVLLGLIEGVRSERNGHACGSPAYPWRLSAEQVFKYAIEKINQDPTILPNLTLGFVIIDHCYEDFPSLKSSFYFLPDDNTVEPWDVRSDCHTQQYHFRVAGITGISSSSKAVRVAAVMSAVHIPVIATTATSDELSNKRDYPYFLRIGPPDKYQSQAILDILEHYGWHYFALVYSEGSYGQNGAKNIERGAKERGLCLALSEMIYSDYTKSEIRDIIDSLVDNGQVRAVVLFTGGRDLRNFFSQLSEDLYGKFIWIGSDWVGFSTYGEPADGALVMHFLDAESEDYMRYIETVNPFNNPDDFWLREAWTNSKVCKKSISVLSLITSIYRVWAINSLTLVRIQCWCECLK